MVPMATTPEHKEKITSARFEEQGMEVVVLDGTPEYATDPNSAIPVISAALAATPMQTFSSYKVT